ncbi:MAG TPA: hypothetical protein VHU80_07840, partial [Polyangiaceae bacterium]|nr:hypothetical protein [Polyangiaceae bacterium]
MRVAIALVLCSGVAGCGRASAQQAFYTGRVAGAAVAPEKVTNEPALPPGSLFIGDIATRCRSDDGVVAIDDESLADVDCSEALLLEGLRERAASVGGTALVGLRCTSA